MFSGTGEISARGYHSAGNEIRDLNESLSLVVLPSGWEFEEGKRLKSALLVEIHVSPEGVLATTYLETEEYGWGDSGGAAIKDLMASLVEYLESLESRRHRLSEPAERDLERLQALLR